jgi:uncharacterized protein YxeA
MKKALKIILGIVAAIAALIAAIFYFTSGMTDTADAFFHSVKQKDLAKARSCLSEDFKASTDENALKAFLSKGAILNFKEANWSERSVNVAVVNLMVQSLPKMVVSYQSSSCS